MSWTTAPEQLRRLLSDGATDKPRNRKKVFGLCDGENKLFSTFEFRRLTNFLAPTGVLGVFVNGVLATVTADDPDFGQFTLQTAPENTDSVEASYYVQWFTDEELAQFLENAAEWIGTNVYLTLPPGLRPSALQYAAAEAYQKLATRYSEMDSERFRLEDGQDPKTRTPAERYMGLSKQFQKQAEYLRKQYYTRRDENEQPLWATNSVPVPNPMPNQ